MSMVFQSRSYPLEFFDDHSKAKFAKDLPNVICITKNVIFNERKVGSPALLRQFQMTLARLLSIM